MHQDPEQKAWWLGFTEGFECGRINVGMTYDNDPSSPRSEAYDQGANIGEWLHRKLR